MKKLRANKRELEQRVETLESRLREERKAAALEATRLSTKTGDSSSPSQGASPAAGSGDVNLAYVKNIVFNLLSNFKSSSLASRIAVVKALAMALHFTPDEENALIGGIIG